jgi:5'-nucleotidase
MLILIDMDDVISDFDGEFYTRWNKIHPEKKIVSPEERKCFYIKDELPEDFTKLIREINTASGFIRSLSEIPGSIQAVKEIAGMGNEVFICTSPLNAYKNCVEEKYAWIEEHLGFEWTLKLILTKDKTLVRGDLLIDDKPEITGVAEPTWEHIIFDKPYNRHVNNHKRINWGNWKEILEISDS